METDRSLVMFDRVSAVLKPVGTVLAGAAVVLLVWSAVLAGWARLVSPRSAGESAWYVVGLHRWGAALPGRMALAAAVVAVVLIAAMAYSVWRGRTGRDLAATPTGAAAAAAVLFMVYVSQGIPAFYRLAMEGAPVTTALPFGMTAWWMTLAGAVLALVAARAFPSLDRGSVRLLAIGAAVAVVVAAVVTVIAARTGDDDRYLDATTASSVDVPAAPTGLGQRRFTTAVPDAFQGDQHQPAYELEAAGAGFVVFQGGRVTAYGADGAQRWHFSRTGPGPVVVKGIRVFDDGATVVAFLDEGVIGLDAMTGERLWTSTDARMAYALSQDPGYNLVAPFVVYRDDRVWVRFDTRTGEPMWTVPAPHADCEFPPRAVDTDSWLVSVLRCPSGDGNAVRVLAMDPRNGEIRWEKEIFAGGTDTAAVATPANGVGIFMQLSGAGTAPGILYANVADKTVTPLPPRGQAEPSPGPSDDFLFTGSDRRLVLFGAAGAQRCVLDQPVRGVRTGVLGQGGGIAYVSFGDRFVVADASSLRTFDAATCAQTASVPAESVEGLLPVPGAVLVVRRDGQTLQIDGYAG